MLWQRGEGFAIQQMEKQGDVVRLKCLMAKTAQEVDAECRVSTLVAPQQNWIGGCTKDNKGLSGERFEERIFARQTSFLPPRSVWRGRRAGGRDGSGARAGPASGGRASRGRGGVRRGRTRDGGARRGVSARSATPGASPGRRLFCLLLRVRPLRS